MLNQLTNFWFDRLGDVIPNHLVETDVRRFPADLQPHADYLDGRSVLVRKAEVVPYECVARGYLAGSAFREYQETGRACGHDLPAGMTRAEQLDDAIFTPATKAEEGHDENIDYDTLVEGVGGDMAATLRRVTLELYSRGRELAAGRGLILADTKFEFGMVEDRLILIDEVLTPDSSRYWDAAQWRPGTEPVSFDKQPGPRLGRRDRLGQGLSAAGTDPRGRQRDQGALSRRVPPCHRPRSGPLARSRRSITRRGRRRLRPHHTS